jgi:hypothetical protein
MPTLLVLAALAAAVTGAAPADPGACRECHLGRHPEVIADWELSAHARAGVGCVACHGAAHDSTLDVGRAALPTAEACGACHAAQLAAWRGGKHSRAWLATERVRGFRHASAPAGGGRLLCLDCHRVGVTSRDLPGLRAEGAVVGLLACTSCHGGHAFSRLAARQPETCARCHAYDHPQWGAWASSPHGVARVVREGRVDPDAPAPPRCQECHFPGGDHRQRTPWGTLGLPLATPNDPAWAEDRALLLRALGVLEAGGADGRHGLAYREARVGPLDRVEYQLVRSALGDTCRGCHPARFVRERLDEREAALRKADRLAAEAVRELLPLHEMGTLDGPFPDLDRARTGFLAERRLAEMIFDHRSRFVAALFHGSPTADAWMAKLERDRTDVRRLAMQLLVLPVEPRPDHPAGR